MRSISATLALSLSLALAKYLQVVIKFYALAASNLKQPPYMPRPSIVPLFGEAHTYALPGKRRCAALRASFELLGSKICI